MYLFVYLFTVNYFEYSLENFFCQLAFSTPTQKLRGRRGLQIFEKCSNNLTLSIFEQLKPRLVE